MAESRLFRILYILLENGRITAPELARLFEVSVRTIYRDIERLSIAGIPLYSVPGKAGGTFLMKDFVLDRTLVSGGKNKTFICFTRSPDFDRR